MSAEEARAGLAQAIDAVEEAYEFFLAYAAQGITVESDAARAGPQLRKHLEKMASALDTLGPSLGSLLAADGSAGAGRLEAFRAVVEADATRASAILSLVRAQESITSQLIDNLNASVHVRTLLTDLFVLDEVLKLGVDEATAPKAESTS